MKGLWIYRAHPGLLACQHPVSNVKLQRSEPGRAHVLIDARLMVGCSKCVLAPTPSDAPDPAQSVLVARPCHRPRTVKDDEYC